MARHTKFVGFALAAMLLVAAVSAQDAAAAPKAAAPAAAAPKNAADAPAAAGDAAAPAAAPKAPAAPKAAAAQQPVGFGKGKGGGPVHIPKATVHVPTFYLPMLIGKGAAAQRPQVNVTLPAKPVLPKPTFPTKGKGKGAFAAADNN